MKLGIMAVTVIVFIFCGSLSSQEIKIGVNLPLSGNLAPYGKATLDGITLRADEINTAGGIGGRRIALVVEDNKGESTSTKNTYVKLAASDKCVAVIGPITSTNTLAIRRDAAKLKVPVVTPTATNDKVTLANPYIFRTCFNDSFQGDIIARYAFIGKGCRKAAVIMDMNSDYSKGLCKSFMGTFQKLGGQVLAEEGYQQKDTEFGAQLKKVSEKGADTVFVPGYPPELPLIIKQAKVIGLKARLCGADGWDNEAVINGSGENIEGCFIVGAFSREDARPAVQEFVKAFEKKYNSPPGTFGALGADSVSMLVEAMKNGTSPEEIRIGLLGIKDFEAITGNITVTSEGDVIKNAVILEIVRDGDKYTARYKTTVKP